MLGEGVRHAKHCSLSPVGAGESLRNLQRGLDGMDIHLGWLSPFLRAGQWMWWPPLVPGAAEGSQKPPWAVPLTPTTSTHANVRLSPLGLFASSSPAPCPSGSSRDLLWPAGLSSHGKPRQEAVTAGDKQELSQQFWFWLSRQT